MPKTDIDVKLLGLDGNAFFIMGRVKRALIANGHYDLAKEYGEKAKSRDYNDLLAATMEYVNVV